jgi:GNAT superfamily N-acetyltransferase
LFIQPGFEEKGIGSKLHALMLNWYFKTQRTTLWLSTAFNTRAAIFYKTKGWKEAGKYSETEIKFEMSFEDWASRKKAALSK